MPKFGKTSTSRLDSCHKDLQTVMNEVIKYFDCSIISGHRPPEDQFELFKKGRKEQDGKWVIASKGKVVTYKDGYERKSKHNENPSHAVDVVPYPVDWKDERRMDYFAGFVMAIAKIFKNKGIIDHDVVWGADWNDNTILNDHKFIDRPHFQIKIK